MRIQLWQIISVNFYMFWMPFMVNDGVHRIRLEFRINICHICDCDFLCRAHTNRCYNRVLRLADRQFSQLTIAQQRRKKSSSNSNTCTMLLHIAMIYAWKGKIVTRFESTKRLEPKTIDWQSASPFSKHYWTHTSTDSVK